MPSQGPTWYSHCRIDARDSEAGPAASLVVSFRDLAAERNAIAASAVVGSLGAYRLPLVRKAKRNFLP